MTKLPIALFMVCALCVTAAEEDLVLGFRGKSKYRIVVPDTTADSAAAESVGRAADLLKEAFAAQGIKLEIKPESEAKGDQPGIYLGPTKFAAASGVDIGKLSGWQYRHKTVDRNVIIVGHDQADNLADKRGAGKDALPYLGTCFGAAEFAYRHLGARFLKPGAYGDAFVPVSIIHVPRDLDRQGEPYFLEHDFYNSPELFNLANHCRKFQRVWSNWGHQHPVAIPIAKYGKSHPEYFALIGKARQPELNAASGHLCFSNPEVRELIYQHILAKCDEGFDIVEVGQNDGFVPCQCPECAALYGVKPNTTPADGIAYYRDPAWGDKIWTMHRDMALRLMKDRPGKKVMLTSYGPTIRPPRDIKEFPPNAVIEMMDSSAKSFDAWKGIKAPGGFAAYLYNWGNFHLVGLTPLCAISQIAAQNRRLVDNNVRVVQVNGRPMTGQWGLEGPNIYAYLRLGIDPNEKSADELFNEYLQAAFREVETPMRRFFTNIQKRVELLDNIQPYLAKTGNDPLFALGTLYTPDLLNALENDLARAERIAILPEVKGRLDIIRYEFDNLKHIALVINAYRNHHARGDVASLNQLLDALDARGQFIAKVVNGDDKYPKGKNPAYPHQSERNLKYAGRYMDISPFNWDVAKLRANPQQTLRQDKTMEVPRIDKPLTLDSPDWDKVGGQTLIPVGDSGTHAATSFKVLRDRDNLYVRVSGEQPADKMTFAKRGRDAELWLQESVVINLSPTADKSRYYYLAYEPEPSSFNDAAHGFITDLYHPLYGWNDEGWNGKWIFQTRLDPAGGRWESMATIPFASLGTPSPKPGEQWCLNVGRVHFFDTPKKKDCRELSSWTGQINASHIPGDASFGTVTFK